MMNETGQDDSPDGTDGHRTAGRYDRSVPKFKNPAPIGNSGQMMCLHAPITLAGLTLDDGHGNGDLVIGRCADTVAAPGRTVLDIR